MPSRLQKLCRKVNWFKGYIVRPILARYIIDDMELSDESVRLISEHNKLCEKIKDSVTKDYEEKRARIRVLENRQ